MESMRADFEPETYELRDRFWTHYEESHGLPLGSIPRDSAFGKEYWQFTDEEYRESRVIIYSNTDIRQEKFLKSSGTTLYDWID